MSEPVTEETTETIVDVQHAGILCCPWCGRWKERVVVSRNGGLWVDCHKCGESYSVDDIIGRVAIPVAPMGSGHECRNCGRRINIDNDGSWVHDHNGDPDCAEERTP